jgi:dTDP-4-dehydrorhamnose reductase
MEKPLLLITGAGGQLGQEFRMLAASHTAFQFLFVTKQELDVTVESWVQKFVTDHKPAAIVNCAAYTNVERAENEPEMANAGNAIAASNLAVACHDNGAMLVHISTDYVFDGKKDAPYREEDEVNPLNVYGKSKLEGERLIDEKMDRYYILRTSWLYSTFGHNFYKTMLRLAQEKGALNVVSDQFASPTYAGALAKDILRLLEKTIIRQEHVDYGLYHYTQTGIASWYQFAQEIIHRHGLAVPVHPVNTGAFPTKAIRPAYSKLDTHKWEKNTGLPLKDWQTALGDCVGASGYKQG